jgi:hypothetical protein
MSTFGFRESVLCDMLLPVASRCRLSMMRNRLTPTFFFLIAACSGRVASPDVDDASMSSDASADAAPIPSDAPTSSGDATPNVDAAGVDCQALSAQLDALRTEAKTCCPFCNSLQCNKLVDDVCCPISVTGTPSKAFTDGVAQYKAFCNPVCPAIACSTQPSLNCVTTDPTNPSAHGICQ